MRRRMTMVLAFIVTMVVFMFMVMEHNVMAEEKIKVYINESEIISDTMPIIIDGSTYVPIRTVAEKMGYIVEWDNETKTANIALENTILAMQIGNQNISRLRKIPRLDVNVSDYKDKFEYQTDIIKTDNAPLIIDGSTYIPLRSMAEAFDCEVNWNSITKSVYVVSEVDPNDTNIKVRVDGDTLYIMGHGEMKSVGSLKATGTSQYTLTRKSDDENSWVNEASNIRRIVVGDGITSIGVSAFAYFSQTKIVELPNTLKEIDDEAFYNCRRLTQIIIPNSVTRIGRGAFSSCVSLERIEIPDSVTELSSRAFVDCEGLKEVSLPSSLKVLSTGVFQRCRQLNNVKLPNTLEEIGFEAFLGCSGLTHIEIPASVKRIGPTAFGECKSLREVYVPDSIKSIYYNVFYNCSDVTLSVPADFEGSEPDNCSCEFRMK